MAPNLIERILGWLRAGYPEGVPPQDYVALLGVLHRHLTDEEVEAIALAVMNERVGEQPVEPEEIHRHIQQRLLQVPLQHDVQRVAARLAAGGWPLMPLAQVPQD